MPAYALLCTCVEVRGQVQELMLSFQCVGPGTEFSSLGLAAGALTHWAILLVCKYSYSITLGVLTVNTLL